MKQLFLVMFIALSWCTYTYGQCVQGDCNNGTGTIVYSGGGKYQGEFKNGERNGTGTYVWSNGSKYRGSWLDGKMHGNGTYIFADSKVYRGEFKNGVKDGEGVLSMSKEDGGEVIKKGKWKDDLFLETSNRYKYIDLGYAAVNNVLPDFNFQTLGTCTYLNPVSIAYNQGVTNNINVGVFAAYAYHKYETVMTLSNPGVQENVNVDYSYILLGGNVIYNIHLGNLTSITPYVGLSAGYNLRSATYSTGGTETDDEAILSQIDDNAGIFDEFDPELIWAAYGGIRAFPLKKVGVFVEGGLGYSNLRAGLTFRL